MKLPVLITYLKLSEMHPEILNKKLMITSMPKGFPLQSYNSKQIEVGKQYTVKELLEYMISYSDNNATYLLNNNLDLQAFKKAFTDLHLIVPDLTDRMYTTTTKEYSTFFEVLYNAGYLSIENSELAMQLLSRCDFTKGFTAGLPAGVPVAHKFGEWSDSKTIHELHETGIIYINKKAYIFSVMTRGDDVMKLPKVISTLTKSVYDNLSTVGTPHKLAMLEKRSFY
jgi:beta-lactamase class A